MHDAELVRRFNTGDEAAFVEIVRRHRGKMFSVALSLLRNYTDAEEIAQDTFIRAYRSLAGFRGESSLATWLHRIALNLSRNRYSYFLRRHRQSTLSLDSAMSDDSQATFSDFIASDAPNPAQQATAGEFSELVIACMEKLAAHHREILTMRNEMSQSYSDIAEALGISIGTVKSRITRARENLRMHLAETYGETEPEAAANSRNQRGGTCGHRGEHRLCDDLDPRREHHRCDPGPAGLAGRGRACSALHPTHVARRILDVAQRPV